jgi:pimeloyl-ACP methyl ester carboxylesterase
MTHRIIACALGMTLTFVGCGDLEAGMEEQHRAMTDSEISEIPGGDGRFAIAPDGERIAYRVSGAGDVTLVLIHGGFCDSSYWDNFLPAVVDDYRVITLDLAGHGRSSGDRSDWTMEAFAGDVAAVIEQDDAENIILIGHSLGGNAAPLVARRVGDRVKAVIGVDTIVVVQYATSPEAVEEGMAPFRADYAAAMDAYARTGLFLPTEDQSIVDRVASQMAGADPAMAVPALEALYEIDMAPSLEWMHDNGVAFTLINDVIQPTDVEGLRTHIPDMVFVTFSDTGHFPMLTKPEVFNPLLREHIDRLAAQIGP